jgi:hypothetical protein
MLRYTQTQVFNPFDFILSFAFPIFLAVLLFKVSKWGWFTLFAGIGLLLTRDAVLLYNEQGGDWVRPVAHLCIYVFNLLYFLNPRVKTLYFDPKLHWWKTKSRYETQHAAVLFDGKESVYPVLRNISRGGCFLESSSFVPALKQRVEVKIPLPIPLKVSTLKLRGEVRWVSKNPLNRGFGIRFIRLPLLQRYAIRKFIDLGL